MDVRWPAITSECFAIRVADAGARSSVIPGGVRTIEPVAVQSLLIALALGFCRLALCFRPPERKPVGVGFSFFFLALFGFAELAQIDDLAHARISHALD
jgi:hypothetical protein